MQGKTFKYNTFMKVYKIKTECLSLSFSGSDNEGLLHSFVHIWKLVEVLSF